MKYGIYTLGCKVNTYESNVMADVLHNHGYQEGTDQDALAVAVINTCTVTNTADQKSKKLIRRVIHHHPEAIVVVVGCLSQNKKEEVMAIPGVAVVLGNVDKSHLLTYIAAYQKTGVQQVSVGPLENVPFETMKLNNFNKTRAFVKIQDGCNNFCSYCIIPYTRGDVRSKKREDVLEEVRSLIAHGHKEIVLTGIHTGNYGAEFKQYQFADLLEELVQISGLERLRISSIEITELNERVLAVLEKSPILVDHLHVPLQSGSDSVLKRMNRKYNSAYFMEKIAKIRSIRPNISITTDVIVGFPGESWEEFTQTITTIQRICFTKLHVFPYSRRVGTVADQMPDQIAEVVKKERVHQLMALSKQLEIEYMEKFIGTEVTFLPEIYRDGFLIGHTGNYLNIKVRGPKEQLNQDCLVLLESIKYPYIEGTVKQTDEVYQ